MDAVKSHGGRRLGAGRKAIYGEPTVSVRIPQSAMPAVASMLAERKERAIIDVDFALKSLTAGREAATLDCGRTPHHGPATLLQVWSDSGQNLAGLVADLNRRLYTDKGKHVALVVRNWKDANTGIRDGSLVIVDRSATAEAGQIVVIELEGQLILCKVNRDRGRWSLIGCNEERAVKSGSSASIPVWGVVVWVLNKT
jgi:DNA polymerase V